MRDYESVIGLEIHAELATRSKMFCGCRVVDSVEASPNTAVCPVCLGMPGMLPVINKRAVDYAIRVSLALNCKVQEQNLFARKNYFYPDLPKAYQISQYELPLARNGWLDLYPGDENQRRIHIRRVHMEEDTGKLTHLSGGKGSLVDFNRSGVPLLEIVSEPDLRSPEETRRFAMKIRQILRYLEVNSGDLEKGVIRFEANISLRPLGAEAFGTRTEIKNLNSFRALTDSLIYEIDRQKSILDVSDEVVQDTMGWNESLGVTFGQRGKEEAHDYRYFPEPDLPPLFISGKWIEKIQAELPELPDVKTLRYQDELGLNPYDSTVLTEDRLVSEWFDSAVEAGGDPGSVSKWMINVLFSLMNENRTPIEEIRVSADGLVELLSLIDEDLISPNTAKDVLAEMFSTGRDPRSIVAGRGLAQISDESQLAAIIDQILEGNPDQLTVYLGGKEEIRGWFVGQVMASTRGKANPQVVNRLLTEKLNEIRTNDIGG